MAIKKLQNNYTTPEQSKRLLELGVPEDSADAYVSLGFENLIWIRNTKSELSEDFFDAITNGKSANIPIWSVGRLIEIMGLCYDFELPSQGVIQIYKTDIEKWSVIDILISDIERFISKLDFSKLEE